MLKAAGSHPTDITGLLSPNLPGIAPRMCHGHHSRVCFARLQSEEKPPKANYQKNILCKHS